jgi:hypothetical protein
VQVTAQVYTRPSVRVPNTPGFGPRIRATISLLGMAGLAEARGRVVINGALLYKPHQFAISGDGDFLVRDLHWHSWGGETAGASGQAVEQERPSHVDHTYPVRVTLSRRTFCANLHRTV